MLAITNIKSDKFLDAANNFPRASNEPGQVTGLVATPGIAEVNLTWTRPASDGGSPITGYNVFWSTDNINYTKIVIGNVTTYLHTGYVNGQFYYYKVGAVNVDGEGINSSYTFTTTFDVPGMVLGITLTPGKTHVNLTWTPPMTTGGSPITGYNVFWSTDNVIFTMIGLGNVTAYQHTGLASGQWYHYAVSAVNAVGQGNNYTIPTRTLTEPGQVTSLVATPGLGHVNLTWALSSNGGTPFTGCNVYWSTDNNIFTKIELGVVTEYQHASLPNGQVYYYKVSANNSIGEGANSTVKSTTTWSVPGQVTFLSPTIYYWYIDYAYTWVDIIKSNISLWWVIPSDGGTTITGYNVYRSMDNITFTKDESSVNSYTHWGLTRGQVYYYKVSANNSLGEGANSTVVSATTWNVPGQVTGLVAVPRVYPPSYINLTWNVPSSNGGKEIARYNVYWSTDNITFTRIQLWNVIWYEHGLWAPCFGGLLNGQVYYYKVSANNSMGEGANSTVASATTYNVPGQVTGLVATAGNAQVQLTWTAPSNGGQVIVRYEIYVWKDGGAGGEFMINVYGATEYLHTGLMNGVNYSYTVTAINAVGYGVASIKVSATPAGEQVTEPPASVPGYETWFLSIAAIAAVVAIYATLKRRRA